MKRTILFALTLAVIFSLTAFSATEVSVYMEWFTNQTHSPLIVAKELGFYDEVGIDLTILPGADEPWLGAREILAGRAQFCLMETPYLAQAIWELNFPIKAIGAFNQQMPNCWVSLPTSPLDSFADLAGKIVNASPGFIMEDLTVNLLEIMGLEPPTFVSYGWGAGPVLSGKAYAGTGWVNWEPYEIQRELGDVNVIRMADYIDGYGLIIVTSNQIIADDPALVRDFLAATLRGFEYVRANPTEAVQMVLDFVPDLYESDVTLGIQVDLDYLWDYEANGASHQFYMSADRWDAFLRAAVFAETLDVFGDVGDLYTNEFLR